MFILVNGRALAVLVGSSSSLLHSTYSIICRKDSIYYILKVSRSRENSLEETSDYYQHHSIRLAQQQFHNAEHALKKTKLKSCIQIQAQLHSRATIYS